MSMVKPKGSKDVQKEYKTLLSSIKPLIYKLDNTGDATLCLLWLSKLDEVSIDERPLRNKLLSQLRDNVVTKKLKPPFNEAPSEESLSQFVQNKNTKQQQMLPSRDFDSLDGNAVSSIGASLEEDGIARYQERSKLYKKTIAQYQSILKDIMSNPSNNPESICDCDEQGEIALLNMSPPRRPKENFDFDDLIQRIKRLEEENESLRNKQVQLQDQLKKSQSPQDRRHKPKKTNGNVQNMRENLMNELKKIIDCKDGVIRELENQLHGERMQRSSIDKNRVEGSVIRRCDDLELRYQRLLEEVGEEHRREREADRDTIEKLQNLLLSVRTN